MVSVADKNVFVKISMAQIFAQDVEITYIHLNEAKR